MNTNPPHILQLQKRLSDFNENLTSIQKILFAKKAARNPLNLIPFFANKAPESIEDAAGMFLFAGYSMPEAIEHVDYAAEKFCQDSIALSCVSALSEFLGQMYENEKLERGTLKGLIMALHDAPKISIKVGAVDEFSADPADEAAEMSAEVYADATALGIQESFSLNITLNEKQLVAKDFAFQGKSFCLIGPAGSGKTTAQRAVSKALLESGSLSTSNYRIGGIESSAPSIAFCAYTRRAANNLRKAIHKDPELAEAFRHNVMTIHALLEYAPEVYWDSIEGKEKFRFAPRRTAKNPLTITHLVIEESSMVGAYDLWEKLYDALPEGVQIIFIGDINQLPPAFGPSILNFALTQLPIVELTEVYRNQGMVLENAHRILKGQGLIEGPDIQVVRGNKPVQLGQEAMSSVTHKLLKAMTENTGPAGLPVYDPENDIVLSSFNVQPMGTENMNKWIAQFIGSARGAVVHEVIASFQKIYLAIGDKVMVNKRDGVIKDIRPNPGYYGKEPQLPGADLSRFGHRIIGKDAGIDFDDLGHDINYENFSLEALQDEKMERKQQASSIVEVDYGDGLTEEIMNAGDFAPAVFSLGYALTVYKAQGSEWRKVIFLMHKDHSTLLFREAFYTAFTRARTQVTLFAKDYIIAETIKRQRIKGNTLKDKLAYFNSGINDVVEVRCTK